MNFPERKEFHKAISFILYGLEKSDQIGTEDLFAISLGWKLILIQRFCSNEVNLADFLQVLVDIDNPKNNLKTDQIDDKHKSKIGSGCETISRLLLTIPSYKNTRAGRFFDPWEDKCFEMFSGQPLLASECLKYLKMLNKHFGYNDEHLILSIRLIHHIYVVNRQKQIELVDGVNANI